MGLNHSHSILSTHRNALIYKRKFLLTVKHRQNAPSEFLAFDFEAKFDRSAKFSVSRTIGIIGSIFEIYGNHNFVGLAKKTVSPSNQDKSSSPRSIAGHTSAVDMSD
jgi:hypothetical protein